MRRLRSVIWLLLFGVLSVTILFWNRSAITRKPIIINSTPVSPVPTLDSASVSQGAALYAQFCATCHGTDLEGAPDWKKALPDGSLAPPPQDSAGHTWHHADTLLLEIISNGGDPADNSKMPAFGDQLTKDEMVSILDFIKSKWGKDEREYQWWMTATHGNP